jgi:hypothetical protein
MYEYIERFYAQNRSSLIEGSLRPTKSYSKEPENYIEKLKDFYKKKKSVGPFAENDVAIALGVTQGSNVVNETLDTMQVLNLVDYNKSDRNASFTNVFVDFVESEAKPISYIFNLLCGVKSLDTISSWLNLIICTLREGYLYGAIIDFPDDASKFEKEVVQSNKERYLSRIKDVYGYAGRVGSSVPYTPNLTQRSLKQLINLGFIHEGEKTPEQWPTYKITSFGNNYLRLLNLNFSDSNDASADNVDSDDKLTKQKIVFGAPGTGKSFLTNDDAKVFLMQDVIRFKPDERREKFENKLIELVNNKMIVQNRKDDYIQYLSNHSDFASKLFSCNKINEIKKELNVRKKELDDAKKGSDDEKKQSKTAFWIVKRYLEFASDEPLFIQHVERVTFHPNYSFAQFVGTYKPIQDTVDKNQIRYEYIPGPFMRAYKRAVKYPKHKILLIIEEINRANVATVFGDVFQLLDRKNGVSEYPIAASEDIRKYLKDNGIDDCKELKIPSNMYIWATMNSADQGVFPMDTAFKRRWEFEYIDVDHDEKKIQNYLIPINDSSDKTEIKFVRWNALRRKINAKLTNLEINEDKLMGPFFLNLSKLEKLKEMLNGIESLTVKNEDYAEDVDDGKKTKVFSVAVNSISEGQKNAIEAFRTAFCGKVLMYLFEDAAKMRKTKLFNTEKIGQMRFSCICNKFADIGLDIFDFTK